jgi:hypothetical protein
MRGRIATLAAALAAALGPAGTAGAASFYLSTDTGPGGSDLGTPPLNFSNGTVVRYDDATDTATVFFDETLFNNGAGNENVDAFELLANGDILLSTTNPADLGGLDNFDNGDLVQYDLATDIATLFFNDSLLTAPGSTNVDAVAVLPNGHVLLSTTTDQILGGVSFRNGDVIEWAPSSPTTGTTIGIFFNENLFGADPTSNLDQNVNLDAFDVLDDGRIVLSTFENNVTLGGLTFLNGDLVLYDPVAGTATRWFDESLFGGNEDIDAVAVPEPNALGLLTLGLVGVAIVGRRRRR